MIDAMLIKVGLASVGAVLILKILTVIFNF